MDEYRKWLNLLREGHHVSLVNGPSWLTRKEKEFERIAKIERITKTQIVIDRGVRFLLRSGLEHGRSERARMADWSRQIVPVTKEHQDISEQRQKADLVVGIRDALRFFKWSELPLESLQRVWAVVKEVAGEDVQASKG